MRCSKCGTNNPSTNNFCAKCGNALAKHCAKCNAENPPTSDFCGKCGTPLAGGSVDAAVILTKRATRADGRTSDSYTSPVTLRERRPAALRPVGEGAARVLLTSPC